MNQRQPVITPPSGAYSGDEIDLMDLVDILVRRKWMVIVLTSLLTAAGVLYCAVTPKVYQAKLSISPPNTVTLAPLQVNLPGVDSLGALPTQIYERFVSNLQDSVFLKDVWEELVAKGDENKVSFAEFNRSIGYQKSGSRQQTPTVISFEGTNQANVAAVLDFVVRKANHRAVEWSVGLLVESLNNRKARNAEEMERRKLDIRAEIASLRQQEEFERLAKIKLLEENLRIAVRARAALSGFRGLGVGEGKQTVVILGGNFPSYVQGEQILKAELAELCQRKSNDPSIEKLPELQAELAMLEDDPRAGIGAEVGQLANPFFLNAKVIDEEIAKLKNVIENPDIIRAVSVDLPPSVPLTPIRPQTKKVIAFCLVAGLVVSVITVFVVNFFEVYAQRKMER